MRRLLAVTGVAVLAFCDVAFATSAAVRPTVMFTVIQAVDIEPGDPPVEEWLVPWLGHGIEHAEHRCGDGDEVEWRFVLAPAPVDGMAWLDATFATGDRFERVDGVGGELRGHGAPGTVHFTLVTGVELSLVEAVARLQEEPHADTRLVLSATECIGSGGGSGADA